MTETLRFPWEEDQRREVAPSTFRPRKNRKSSPRTQASRKPRESTPRRRAAVSRSPGMTARVKGSVGAAGRAAREDATHDRTAGRVVKQPPRERHEPDYVLMAVALALSAIGILMVYSSSGTAAARRDGGTVFDDVAEQLMWGLIGGLVLLVMSRIDYRHWRSFSVLGIVFSLVLLVFVIGPSIPPLLEPLYVNGATRWLQIGGLPSFQPSEIAKLALVLFLAHFLAARGTQVGSFRRGMLPFLFVVGPMAALIVIEPDLGTTGVVVLTGFAMLFVAGGSLLQILALVPVALGGVAFMIMNTSYMQARLDIWQNPLADAVNEGHQIYRGINSLAWGGLTGIGLGQSHSENGLYVPAAENDFIFSVIGQEFGFIGALVVIGLFLVLAWRGMRVAADAPDTFGGLLALGITAWLTFQALINIGVVVSLIPMTGLPLPFLSKGGTSLVVVLAAVGMLLSISRETVNPGRGTETRGADADEDPHRGRGHGRPYLPRGGRRVPAAEPPA